MAAQWSREQVENLLCREARLLDERLFDEWLTMFTKDARYWCPANTEDIDPDREVSLIYDDAPRMADRIWRLKSGMAFAQQPPSRTRHFTTNIEIIDGKKGELVVHSNILLLEVRRGKQTVLGGHCEHHLRQEDGVWKISFKKVSLINNDLPIDNLTFPL